MDAVELVTSTATNISQIASLSSQTSLTWLAGRGAGLVPLSGLCARNQGGALCDGANLSRLTIEWPVLARALTFQWGRRVGAPSGGRRGSFNVEPEPAECPARLD